MFAPTDNFLSDTAVTEEETDILNDEQKIAFNKFIHGDSFFLSGPAGCGKSFLINYIKRYCNRKAIPIAITALTGAAATLVNGVTLHSWSGIGLAEGDAKTICAIVLQSKNAPKNWKYTQVLVIDEVSMLSSALFTKLDEVARKVRDTLIPGKCFGEKFFGGLQVIFSGDFAQLEPIEKGGAVSQLLFENSLWRREIEDKHNYVILKKLVRQTDGDFQHILNNMRLGLVDEETRRLLNSRLIDPASVDNYSIRFDGSEETIKPTRLFPLKRSVDEINTRELKKLELDGARCNIYKSYDYKIVNKQPSVSLTQSESEKLEKIIQKDKDLAVGAQVMYLINTPELNLVNGSRGVVSSITDEGPKVIFDDGVEHLIRRHSFTFTEGEKTIFRQQIPLILAWALTIHKCQGATLSHVVTDLRDAFCNAQVYVTLSRVRSLEGLYITGINYKKITVNPKVLDYYTAKEGTIKKEDQFS